MLWFSLKYTPRPRINYLHKSKVNDCIAVPTIRLVRDMIGTTNIRDRRAIWRDMPMKALESIYIQPSDRIAGSDNVPDEEVDRVVDSRERKQT
jgi:hypothetical protein